MKTAIVPAQITTVEDKIAGSLTLSQLLLLAAPVFGSAVLYIIFPPNLRFTPFKTGISCTLLLVCGLLAIRVRGKLLLLWVLILLRYRLRPRYHIYNKNDLSLRDTDTQLEETETHEAAAKTPVFVPLPPLDVADTVRLENLLANPRANLTLTPAKKGGLRVTVTKVE